MYIIKPKVNKITCASSKHPKSDPRFVTLSMANTDNEYIFRIEVYCIYVYSCEH